jgi:hypothetical protein
MLAVLRDLLCRFCAQSADLAPMSLCGSGEGLRGIRVHMSENDGLPCSGVASPAARWLDAEHGRAGRVKVRVDLSVPSHSDIFAVGDTAAGTDQPGIPGTAPPAKQMGCYADRLIAARVAGTPSPPPFVWPPDQSPHDAGDPPSRYEPSFAVTRLLRSVPPPPYPLRHPLEPDIWSKAPSLERRQPLPRLSHNSGWALHFPSPRRQLNRMFAGGTTQSLRPTLFRAASLGAAP